MATRPAGADLTAAPQSRMTAQQIAVVFVAILITTVDGFDVQAMAFAAPALSKAWHIEKGALGLVLGSGLFGMAAGSLFLSPLGDVFGRRPTVLAGLALMVAGSLTTALATGIFYLVVGRLITGVGVGVMIPLTTAIAAEYASERRRTFAVAATTVGHSVGGAGGGLIGGFLLTHYEWPAIFIFGTVAGVAVLVVAAIGLPRGVRRLAGSTADDPISLSQPTPEREHDPRRGERPVKRGSYRDLFAPGQVGPTVRLALIYIFLSMAAYYLLSWLPQLVADAGQPPATASRLAGFTGMVGIVSGLLAGALARRVGPVLLGSIAMIGFGLSLIVLGLVPPTLIALFLAAGCCALFAAASAAVFYATMATTFPDHVRVSGIGLVLGFGRLLSAFSPYVAGLLFGAGLGRDLVSVVFAALAITAGILLILGRTRRASPSIAPAISQ